MPWTISKSYWFGPAEGAAGIPEGHANYPDEIYDAVLRVEDGIIAGKLTPPAATREAYEAFLRENM